MAVNHVKKRAKGIERSHDDFRGAGAIGVMVCD